MSNGEIKVTDIVTTNGEDDVTSIVEDVVTDVVNTNGEDEVIIPFRPGQETAVKQQVVDIQTRFAEVVAKQFKIEVKDIMECFPSNIVFKQESKKSSKSTKPTSKSKKPTSKSNKILLENWAKATSTQELKTLKLSELKDILKSNELKTSGSKEILADRVWGINHPDDVKDEPVKKRGRPKGSKKSAYVIVSDTDDEVGGKSGADSQEQDNIEELLQNSTEMVLNGKTLNVVSSKKWVFTIDDEGDFTWEGMLNNDGESFEECDPPDELLKFYEE
jgi:hypothetical protein